MNLLALFAIALLLSIAIAYIQNYYEPRFPGTSQEYRWHVITLRKDTLARIYMTIERQFMKITPASLWQTTIYGQSMGRVLLLAAFWQFGIVYLVLSWELRTMRPKQ